MQNDGTVAGIAYADEDVLTWDSASNTWALLIDGSDVGLGDYNEDIASVNQLADGSYLISFAASANLPGLGWVDDSDIIRFVPIHLGDATDGSFEWYLDGSDVGLDTNSEIIDAFGFTPDGRLLVSTNGGVTVPGVTGNDEDLLVLDATQLGANSAGTWSLYFDGTSRGLGGNADLDVDAIDVP
jgi:hypothetical protein